MSMSTGGIVAVVLVIILILIVTVVLVVIKCRNQSPKYQPWKPTEETGGTSKKPDPSPTGPRSRTSSSRSPLFDRRQTPAPHLVIPLASSTPNVTTIHIPVSGTRHHSDTDSDSSSSTSERDEERLQDDVDQATDGLLHSAERTSDDALAEDGDINSKTPQGVGLDRGGTSSSSDDQAERDADEEGSASCTLSPAHSAPEISVVQVMSAPEMGGSSRNKSTLESDYEETAYSVYRQKKEVLQTPSTAMPHEQEHTTVVDNHLPPAEKKKKRKRRGISVPHMPYRHHTKGEGRGGALLLHEQAHTLHKGHSGSVGSLTNLGEPMGKLFIRVQHKASEEKLLLFIDKVADLDLPERLKYRQSFNPALYIKGGFLPSMGQRFITKYAALAENVSWRNEFAIMGISKSAAWQLTLRLCLCFRESSINRIQIIGVCDIALGQINLENSQDVVLNFFPSERIYFDLGDLHLSVCYQPSLQRMVFLVLEARDLPRSTVFGSIHSIAKIEMMCDRKRVEKQKSKVVRETHNPIWNDQIVFTIPPNNIKLQDIQFDVTVLHVDMVKGAHVIGKCELGWSATCEELQHWNDVMQNPNRPIPMWLSLQYPD
ncbi:synaptotagmin-6-like isoform X2 [Acanthaster planci]|uniref:Synaptotagmin-6-like isoform X2 n=1 Tax=Acanthaster planci TaxID=133434 RepID=A0A8B7ZTE8_ACAPL|nr:synaptotagmin-6-like isoform X2 [Acanthaster planci]